MVNGKLDDSAKVAAELAATAETLIRMNDTMYPGQSRNSYDYFHQLYNEFYLTALADEILPESAPIPSDLVYAQKAILEAARVIGRLGAEKLTGDMCENMIDHIGHPTDFRAIQDAPTDPETETPLSIVSRTAHMLFLHKMNSGILPGENIRLAVSDSPLNNIGNGLATATLRMVFALERKCGRSLDQLFNPGIITR